jgi:hypothetical protein
MKIAFAAIALIGAVLVATPYAGFNRVLPVFALLGLGSYGVCRGAPALQWREGMGRGHGWGIYFSRDGELVQGRESDKTFDVNDGAPRDDRTAKS